MKYKLTITYWSKAIAIDCKRSYSDTQQICDTIAGTRCWGEFGLLNEPGTHVWSAKRRLMDPAFHKTFLRTTMTGMNQVGTDMP